MTKKIPENSINCISGCNACCGPVPINDTEASILNIPNANIIPTKPDLTCIFSSPSGCTVYNDRPLLCRLYGITEHMPCGKNIKSTKSLTNRETNKIMRDYKLSNFSHNPLQNLS